MSAYASAGCMEICVMLPSFLPAVSLPFDKPLKVQAQQNASPHPEDEQAEKQLPSHRHILSNPLPAAI